MEDQEVQWDGGGVGDRPTSGLSIIRWIRASGGRADVTRNHLNIQTAEGVIRANVGDWIVKGANGEFKIRRG